MPAGGTHDPRPAIADSFAQLVVHVLAHVPLRQAGNLHDPRYVAWARPRMSEADRAMLEHDAALLARCWSADAKLDLIHGFCALHRGLGEFAATRDRSLAQLDAGSVRAPALLAELAQLPAAELLHANLALLTDGFVPLLKELRAPLRAAQAAMGSAMRRVSAAIPDLAGARVELVWALGHHGRAFDDRILVGAPSSWSGCSPMRQAVLAAHEHLVTMAEARGYVEQEWFALTTLARRIASHDDDELRRTHQRWLAELELSELLTALVDRGQLDEATTDRLWHEPEARARELAELAPGPGDPLH